jgi:hypothetical protein
MKSYHFSLGNSNDGAIGFCASVQGKSEGDAVDRLKRLLPTEVEVTNSDFGTGEYLAIYFNPTAIRAQNIDEVEEPGGVL